MGDFAESIRPLRRVEYDRMVELGLFENEKVELLRGFLVHKSPQGVPHASVVQALTQLLILRLVATQRAAVRVQSPLAVGDDSEPEPDLAVVPLGDYRDHHPDAAFLIIEVAESSLARDRTYKTELYASAGVPEYWVVDTTHGLVEVRTAIEQGVYTQVARYRPGQDIVLGAFPDVAIAVSDILG